MSLEAEAVSKAATVLGTARLECRSVPALPVKYRPQNADDGYRIQDALSGWFAKAERTRPAGYKIGATTPTMQDMLGVGGPARGWIRGSAVHADGIELPATDFQAPGIECEIAFRIAQDLDARAHEITRSEAAAAVAQVMPAIEIVDNRYGDWSAIGVPTLIADDFFQAACVLGAPASEIDPMGLDLVSGRTILNGEVIGQGSGADVLGHPLAAVIWLAESLAKFDRVLEAGMLVMTGSMVRPDFLQKFPVEARVEIDGLGTVATRLT